MSLQSFRFCIRRKEQRTQQNRTIELKGGHRRTRQISANKVTSTKYRWYSFLPKSIYEQLRRVANLYFLFHALITLTPVSPVNPVTTIIPFAFVIGVAIAKEGIEDLKRGRHDKDVNFRLVHVVCNDGTLKKLYWKDLNAGDIVRVSRDEFFPADLLFLSSNNPNGTCYVETANLDGETNLKIKKCLDDTLHLTSIDELRGFEAQMECEPPNAFLYSFAGYLNWKGKTLHLSPSQVLLRGSKLRNTEFVYGVVIYTGFETKVMMNSTDPPSKRSSVERQLDYIILFQLILLVFMSTLSAAVFANWLALDRTKHWYLQPGTNSGKNSISKALFDYQKPFLAGFLQFFTCLVLYGYFVPISLYVSMEIVKTVQAFFINSDIHLYYEKTGKRASARTSNLNEELGQVSFILSDKTGTLTKNEMEFLKCSIAGVSYGTSITEVERGFQEQGSKDPKFELSSGSQGLEKGFALRDARLEELKWQKEGSSNKILRFLEVLALCNTVVIDGLREFDKIKYITESPDEASLVVAAKRLGVFLYERSETVAKVRLLKEGTSVDLEYGLLNTIDFNSARKRMSVIVRNPSNSLLLLCKGADEVIFDRLASNGKEFLEITRKHMNEYAEAGLRTLAIAYRELDDKIYADWLDRWIAAKEKMGAERFKLDELADEIERDLKLVGATAIEDKLQDGVPHTIDALAKAGIKIWVLTGDKVETAINIGYACNLLRADMSKHIIHMEDKAAISLQESTDFVASQLREGNAAINMKKSSHAIIIDGNALIDVLHDERTNGLKQEFMTLASRCDSVICCRVSPIQKADVTELVRAYTKEVCLAVGDGANDVGMIQKANIGVGISGLEGQQAAMAADFSIAQFRFLEKLLLVHGAWCFRRTTLMIKYFFYKNFVFGISILLFNAYTRFSGQSIYSDWFLSLYNTIFTAAPVVVVAVLDQDVNSAVRLKLPQLYKKGEASFNARRLFGWMLNGILQACICFFAVVYGYGHGRVCDRRVGWMVGLFTIGTTMYTCVVCVVNLQFAVAIQYWTWIHHVALWGELVLWIAFLLVIGELPVRLSGELRRLFIGVVASSWSFYIIVLLTLVAALLPTFAVHGLLRNFKPADYHIAQELEKKEMIFTKGSHQVELVQLRNDGVSKWGDTFRVEERPLCNSEFESQPIHQESNAESEREHEIMEVMEDQIWKKIPTLRDLLNQ